MKYKGYKSQRAYHNAKLHALAVIIATDEYSAEYLKSKVLDVLNKRSVGTSNESDLFTEVTEYTGSTTELTDQEAADLYRLMVGEAKKVKNNEKAVAKIVGTVNDMTDQQRALIIKLTKHKYSWSVPVTFSKILEFVPALRKKLTPWEIQHTKIIPLYDAISKSQADKIIKRLIGIEKRNDTNSEKGKN